MISHSYMDAMVAAGEALAKRRASQLNHTDFAKWLGTGRRTVVGGHAAGGAK